MEKDDVYWNFPDPDLRDRMVMIMNEKSTARLSSALTAARARLLACDKEGQRKRARFFAGDQAGKFQRMGLAEDPELLGSLLFVEAELVKGAATALKDVAAFLEASPSQPLEAIERLAWRFLASSCLRGE